MSYTNTMQPVGQLPDTASDKTIRSTAINLAIGFAFVCVMIVQITHHQMWRDETQVWGMVLASPTLPALFHNLHYDGHPGLWYLLLWCVSWVTSNPIAVQAVHAVIAAGFIMLIAVGSPFPRLEKILLLTNFFVLYEYSVVSRNYGIGLLFALIYAGLRASRPDRVIAIAIVLGLLANTNIFATVLSLVLALEYLLHRLMTRCGSVVEEIWALAAGATIYLGFVLLCIATIGPAADISWRTNEHPFMYAFSGMHFAYIFFSYVTMSLSPVAELFPLEPRWIWILLTEMLAALAIGAVIWIFRWEWQLRLIVGLTALGAIAIGHLIHDGSARHAGIIFVALVVALWLQQTWRPGRSLVVVGLLAAGSVFGVTFSVSAALQPMSRAPAAARWLDTHGLRDAALMGTADTSVGGVAILLGRPIYFLDCSCTDTFLRFNRRRDDYSIEQLPDRIAVAMQTIQTRPVILVTSFSLSGNQTETFAHRGIEVRELAALTGARAAEEDFFIYRVTDSQAKP